MGDTTMTLLIQQTLLLLSLIVTIVCAYDGPLYPPDMNMPMAPDKHAKFDMIKWDHDKNGKVDHAEISEEIRKMYYPKRKRTKKLARTLKKEADEYLTELDRDKDGFIVEEEFVKYHEEDQSEENYSHGGNGVHPDADPLHDYSNNDPH